MSKVVLFILLTISPLAFSQTKFSLSGVTCSNVTVEDESLSMLGTVFTPTSGVSFNLAYKTSFSLELGLDLTYAETAKYDDEQTDLLEYQFLTGGPYIGFNLYFIKPFVGYNVMNLKYNNSEKNISGRYDGYAPNVGVTLEIYQGEKLNTEAGFSRSTFSDKDLDRDITVDVFRLMLSRSF